MGDMCLMKRSRDLPPQRGGIEGGESGLRHLLPLKILRAGHPTPTPPLRGGKAFMKGATLLPPLRGGIKGGVKPRPCAIRNHNKTRLA
jgi:hypothetical protein